MREAAVHAGADGVGAVAEEYFSARALYGASQSHIFEQVTGNGSVSADGIVGFAGDQEVLAVGGRGGGAGIAHLRWAKAGGEFGEDHGHYRFFAEAFYDLLGRVREQGRAVALATVVETWGSAPRPVGSNLVIDQEGNFLGSVSGGCVEGAVVTEALDVIDNGKPKILEFGVADETAWKVGLSCGGTIRVLVEKVE